MKTTYRVYLSFCLSTYISIDSYHAYVFHVRYPRSPSLFHVRFATRVQFSLLFLRASLLHNLHSTFYLASSHVEYVYQIHNHNHSLRRYHRTMDFCAPNDVRNGVYLQNSVASRELFGLDALPDRVIRTYALCFFVAARVQDERPC